MARNFIPFLLVFLMLAPCCPGLASAAEANKTVKAGVFSFDGYHDINNEGQLGGYGIDFLNLLSKYSHLNFTFSGFDKSWQEMQEMLKKGEIDLLTSARRTPEREEDFAFSIPIGKNTTVLSVKLNNKDFRIGDYQNWNGIHIGVLKGSTQNALLEKYANNRGFTYTITEFEDAGDLQKALQDGTVDAILTSNLRKTINEKPLATVDSSNFYAIVRKEDKDLLNEINYAIEQMDLNEGDWRNILFYKNYGPADPAIKEFTAREQNFIEDVRSGLKGIKVMTATDRPPYSYVENGKVSGIIPDYFKLLMGQAGLPYTFVRPDRGKFRIEDVDIVLDSAESRATTMDGQQRGFDTPVYLSTGIAQVTRHNHTGPVSVVALTKAQLTPELKYRIPSNATIIYFPTQKEAMQAVADHKADIAYADLYTAQNFVNQDLTNALIYSALNDASVDFRMHVPARTEHELITILDKSMNMAPDGAVSQIIAEYTATKIGTRSLVQYLKENPRTAIFIIIAAAILASLTFGLYIRSKMSKKLLVATEQSNQELEKQLAIVEALSRDYTNIFAVNEKDGSVRLIKSDGLVSEDKNEPEGKSEYLPILQSYIDERVHPEDRDELATALNLEEISKNLDEAPEYTGSYRVNTWEDNTLYYQFKCVRLKSDDASFILAGFRNVDEMIRKEQEQRAVLADALKKANYANVAKTTFLNNMSHDIRTPMNAIIGFTHLASTHLGNSALVQNYLGKIMTSGNHLLNLINDVLDMSRIESGKVKIDEKPASLREIMLDLKTIVQSDVKAKDLDFHMEAVDIYNEEIICDKLRLNQVLINILGNAMKYTLAGGKVKLRVIQLEEADNGSAPYEFQVSDTGIGMSKSFLEHVFEPFEREKTSTVSGIQGTGLGLSITKNIVKMMGGSIRVESETGKGSTFFVNFRFRVGAMGAATEALASIAGQSCLIVDGDIELSTSACRMLKTLGLNPAWTALGKDALPGGAPAGGQRQPYSIYLIERQLPDMDGLDLARQLRKQIGPEPKIIILTANEWSDIEREAQEAGITAFCNKPIFLSELLALLSPPEQGDADANEIQELDFNGKKALLVDDNEMNLEIGQMILESAGLKVDIAEDGTEAVEKIRNAPAGTWDLILMDVQMPVMDGYAATRLIRKMEDKGKAGIPIVAMTANAFEEDRKAAFDAGMDGHVAKPIDLQQLLDTLQTVLGQKRELTDAAI